MVGKKGKGKGKGKLNSVENSSWQEGWSEAGTKQGEEQAEGWWNEEHVLTVGGKMSRQDQVQVQDGGQQTIRHHGNQKDQSVQLKSTVLSRDTSDTMDGDKSG